MLLALCDQHARLHIDEMRTLLEMHYDNTHLQRWKNDQGKAPLRRSEYHVFHSTITARRKKLCQRITLPREMKEMFQVPRHEDELHRLEKLREIVLRETEGEEYVLLETKAQADALARAIEQCPKLTFVDEVGSGSTFLPEGCRVQLDEKCSSKEEVAQVIRKSENVWIKILMRPYGTQRAPLADNFAKKELRGKTVKNLEHALTRPQIMDRMLLCLFDALFLKQSDQWTTSSVANLKADETPEIARWFLRGQQVGAKPLFDGICSMCGTLLHGEKINQHGAGNNKKAGPPIDRDGALLPKNPDGSLKANAQPPFLLRRLPSKNAPSRSIGHYPSLLVAITSLWTLNSIYLKIGHLDIHRSSSQRKLLRPSSTIPKQTSFPWSKASPRRG